MRYRSFGSGGTALSCVGLWLREKLATRFGAEAVYIALENGINVFQVVAGDTAALNALGEALKHVERRLVFVVLRAGVVRAERGDERDFTPPGLVNALRVSGSILRAGAFDLLLLDDPGEHELSPRALESLRREQEAGRVRAVGISGEGDPVDAYISSRNFDVLATPYNLLCGWKERLRLKAAASNEMPVLGYRFFPPEFDARERAPAPPPPVLAAAGKLNLFKRPEPTAEVAATWAGYDFLASVKNWSPQELCLAYSLTDPGLCTMMIAPRSLEELESLAAVADRDFPTFVAAQIEMARFSHAPARSA